MCIGDRLCPACAVHSTCSRSHSVLALAIAYHYC